MFDVDVPMKIGEVARRSAVAIDTIRYYERVGLLPAPPRTPSGYRIYPADTPHRIRFIKRAQELGFSLKEIGQLLDLRVRDAAECKTVQTTALRKVDEVSEKIRQLKAIRDVLTELADTCAGDGRTSECPILKAMDSDPE
jgi:MerR family mercuric resistance operon transcriptional regulator